MPSHAGHSISVLTSFDLGFFIRIYFFVSRRHIILFGTRSLGEAAGPVIRQVFGAVFFVVGHILFQK